MPKELLYATNNPGKIGEVSKLLKFNKIKVVSPKDLGIYLKIPEDGNSLEENALKKAKAFAKVSGGRLVLSDDTGIEIDALDGEPGIYVRRWKDRITEMEDEEIINYCLARLKDVEEGKRGAQFTTVLVLADPQGKIEIFKGTLRGYILEKASDLRVSGFPFESLFFVPEWKMLLGEVRELNASAQGNKLNHREKALNEALPRIKELLAEV